MKIPRIVLACALAFAVHALGAKTLLEDIAQPQCFERERLSSYDRSMGNADNIKVLFPGETILIGDIEGPGLIDHIWFTLKTKDKYWGRKLLLRITWDDAEIPSVWSPVGDFFAMGPWDGVEVNSLPVRVSAQGRALNAWFPMPFNKRARLELVWEGLEPIEALYYIIDWRKFKEPTPDIRYFYASYRQAYPSPIDGKNHVVCETHGSGHYVGTFLAVEPKRELWWGEGDDIFYIDDEKSPRLLGTGAEDYFCDAWGVWPAHSDFYGTSIKEVKYPGGKFASYRWHIADPIPFKKYLRFELEDKGMQYPNGDKSKKSVYGERGDNYSSVAYWYLDNLKQPPIPMPPAGERLPDVAGFEKELLCFVRGASGQAMTDGKLQSLLEQAKSIQVHDQIVAQACRSHGLSAPVQARMQAELGRICSPFTPKWIEYCVLPSKPDSDGWWPVLLHDDLGASSLVREEIDGAQSVRTDVVNGKSRLGFCVPDVSGLRGKNSKLLCQITYRMNKGVSFEVKYDSTDGLGEDAIYKRSRHIDQPSDGEWMVATLELENAFFGARQRGGDFRVDVYGNGDLYLRDIRLKVLDSKSFNGFAPRADIRYRTAKDN